MSAAHITERDLIRALREEGGTDDLSQVKAARLERSGNISVVKQSERPQLVDIDVQDGVQTVRIAFDR